MGGDAPHEPGALYEEMKVYQRSGECTARIELRGKGGVYYGRSISKDDGFEGCPGDFVITATEAIPSWEIKDLEMAVHGDDFGLEGGDTRPGPAVQVSLDVSEGKRGAEKVKGIFKMRRLWAQNKSGALEEVFEGILDVGIFTNTALQHTGKKKTQDRPDTTYLFSFWAIRARKRADGTVIGVKDLKVEDGDEDEGDVAGFNDNDTSEV